MNYYSYAKINLALDILGKDESGFHLVQTVLQKIPLFDVISIDQKEGEGDFSVKFRGDEAKLINADDNSVVKAIRALNENWSFKNSYEIIVDKKIPLGAGLGGGSSNAATIMTALNAMEIMKLSNEEMRLVGAKIGVDVPFFIESITALGTHYGEQIKLLPPLDKLSIWNDKYKLLVIPQLRKNTEVMYKKVQLDKCGKNKDQTDKIIQALEEKSTERVLKNIHNDFETVADSGFVEIKAKLTQNGAEHVILCGSGTAVFALSSNPFDLKALSQALPNQHILNLNR